MADQIIVRLFEAFYSSMKPVPIISKHENLSGPAKCDKKQTKLEFAIDLVADGKVAFCVLKP